MYVLEAIIQKAQENPDKGNLTDAEKGVAQGILERASKFEQDMEISPKGFELQRTGADTVFKEDEIIDFFNLFARFNRGTPKIYDQKLTGGQTQYFTIGDLHGNLWATKLAIEQAEAQNAHLVILGDFLERGKNSIEVAMYLFAYKMLHPDRITIIAGDHDVDEKLGGVLGDSGFNQEIKDKKYDNTDGNINNAISKATATLPWGIFAENLDPDPKNKKRSFLGHGGITKNLNLIENIRNWGISELCPQSLEFYVNDDDDDDDTDDTPKTGNILNKMATDKYNQEILGLDRSNYSYDTYGLLWSDPDPNTSDYSPNKRSNNAQLFGNNAFAKFCDKFNVKDFIRAHQHDQNSPGTRVSLDINGHRVITTLGAPNIRGGNNYSYGTSLLCNNSAILRLDGMTLEPSIFKEYEAYNKEIGKSANPMFANRTNDKMRKEYNHIREFHVSSDDPKQAEKDKKKKSNL